MDLKNRRYNPSGELGVEEFRFPYPEDRFDAVVSTSVFTQMRSSEVRHYLEEIHRVMRPGGRCLATFFLVNAESRRLIERGASSQRLCHAVADFFTADPEMPEGAIGFDEETLWNWLEARGFTVGETFYGTWCGRSGPGSYQDIVVFEKTARPSDRAHVVRSGAHLVPCAAGGNVVLDAPLFRLFEHARTETAEQAVRSWSCEENQDRETGRWGLAALGRAGLLPARPDAPAISDPPRAIAARVKVSIVIVNCDGRRHLDGLLPTIADQTYPQIETIVVDNGSRHEPVSWLREAFPWVEVISLPDDAGFAGASNRGASEASGDVLFFLNNDTRLDASAVERLVARLEGEESVGAVVPMIRLMAQPAFVNALGNQIQSRGWARDGYIGHLDLGQLSAVRRVPSASFGAVLVPRKAYETVGPLDESYGYYYEDMDWSWRAKSSGLQILAEPRALVFHAASATSAARPRTFKLRLA
ncbi:MAG: glycosyltransferase, partial [Vicinamibacteria bacterium]